MTDQEQWARLLIDGLAAGGVRDVVLSPGSRSTPFVLAASEDERLAVHDIVDERVASFFALGQARVSGRPTLLLCTSGTAAAHYLPAVVEAAASHLPLIVLSADRPPELHGCGANQTIDQLKLFGDHVRAFVELGTARASLRALRAVRRAGVQAVARALDPTPGPVHLNARALKPLEPRPPASRHERAETEPPSVAEQVLDSPASRYHAPARGPAREAVLALTEACLMARSGAIVAGPGPASRVAAGPALRTLLRRTGFVALLESASNLKHGERADEGIVFFDGFDAVLRSELGRRAFTPDFVLQLGAAPVSKGFELWLADNPDVHRAVVAPHGWADPESTARHVMVADIEMTLAAVEGALAALAGERLERSPLATWAAAAEDATRRCVVDALAADEGELSEANVAAQVVAAVPPGADLVLGNSLSVRHADSWAEARYEALHVLTQRGASGIDGLVAGAAGAVRASGRDTLLLLGDVSFLHDVGGLAAARGLAAPLVVVVVDNGGGRIFEQLPVAHRDDLAHHIEHFTTPQEAHLEHAAALYGHDFVSVSSRAELANALSQAFRGSPRCTLVQAVVPAHGAAEKNAALFAAVHDALGAVSEPS